ncbi:MAG: hypothetical protein V4722_17950 [Bacteroidota bacterium]
MLHKINPFKCCSLKNSIYFFAAVAAIASLTGCRLDPEKELQQEWYVTDYHTPLADGTTSSPVNVLKLYKNGKYSQFGNYSNFSFGIWRYDKDKHIFRLHPLQTKQDILDSYYYINEMKPGFMQVSLFRNLPMKPGTEELFFSLEAAATGKSSFDPYKPEMHTWRQKPRRSETDLQISERVKAYLIFVKTMYQHAIDHKFQSIAMNWYPHPLRMHYGNGVRMAYSDELDDWNSCFYDSVQAVKGYQCISGPFQKVKITPGKSKAERNLDIVEQLLRQMK